MNETRRSLIKGMLTGGTLLAFGIPTVTQAVSLSQTFSGSTRNCQLLLGNTPLDEAFAKGAQTACTHYSSYRQGTLPTFKLEDELLTNPLRIVDLLMQSSNMRWIAIMDHGSAAIFTEMVRNFEGRLLSLGSHSSSSGTDASFPMRHMWTTATPVYSAGRLLASLLTQSQHDFFIVENFLGQAVVDSAMKDSSLAGFSSYRLTEQPATHLHCAGVSPLEASQLIGWRASEDWKSVLSQRDESSIDLDQAATGTTIEHLRFDNWIEATGYAVVATALGIGANQDSCSSRAFVYRSGHRYPDNHGLSGKHFVSFVIDV
ncbi:hypothetical protein [Nitrosomonas supralitoralis]|uniref:Uncharacterized protein n=1 Tax=Nitrosomonas supralitoralis TaxID=2116706 RepID=A0A2P7NU68_9PROT|nr:hypothetical protein [Nitrosomonas supralitoralis]PSJ16978.1 hypothetical protein C7H79_10450 [Nitrosomonas supralitoralis]